MQIPRIDPWRTHGTTDRLDAIERAVKIVRKSTTPEERAAGLTLIRKLADAIERHIERLGAPPMPPVRPPRGDPKPEGPPLVEVREGELR
jgi:hypothetical protein